METLSWDGDESRTIQFIVPDVSQNIRQLELVDNHRKAYSQGDWILQTAVQITQRVNHHSCCFGNISRLYYRFAGIQVAHHMGSGALILH